MTTQEQQKVWDFLVDLSRLIESGRRCFVHFLVVLAHVGFTKGFGQGGMEFKMTDETYDRVRSARGIFHDVFFANPTQQFTSLQLGTNSQQRFLYWTRQRRRIAHGAQQNIRYALKFRKYLGFRDLSDPPPLKGHWRIRMVPIQASGYGQHAGYLQTWGSKVVLNPCWRKTEDPLQVGMTAISLRAIIPSEGALYYIGDWIKIKYDENGEVNPTKLEFVNEGIETERLTRDLPLHGVAGMEASDGKLRYSFSRGWVWDQVVVDVGSVPQKPMLQCLNTAELYKESVGFRLGKIDVHDDRIKYWSALEVYMDFMTEKVVFDDPSLRSADDLAVDILAELRAMELLFLYHISKTKRMYSTYFDQGDIPTKDEEMKSLGLISLALTKWKTAGKTDSVLERRRALELGEAEMRLLESLIATFWKEISALWQFIHYKEVRKEVEDEWISIAKARTVT